ncbi:MAG TPA: hypothetical protein VI670_27405 [Thermoanaerobaculia bacterium]|jgi:hypothetical protein
MSVRRIVFLVVALLAIAAGWRWLALAWGAATYPVTPSGDAANVVVAGSMAFAALGERGVEIADAATGAVLGTFPPPPGSESIDDLAAAGGFLFALDARPPGHLCVYSLEHAPRLTLVSAPVEVPVGPFSGVAAGGGRVIVSGGTSLLTLRAYDARGRLGPLLATLDCGRGQPDALLSADGSRAFVSTHRWGPYFGVTAVRVSAAPPYLVKTGAVKLDTYGFTAGGAKPANFPLALALDGDALFAADADGLTVIAGDEPKVIARCDAGVRAVNVDVRHHLAAVVGSSPKPLLVLVDVAKPAAPRIVRSIPLPEGSRPTGVAIGPHDVVVAAGSRGLLRFSLDEISR